MSATPAFAATPKSYGCTISGANTSRATPTAYGTLVAPASAAAAIPSIFIKALGTTTAGLVQFFMYDGTYNYLIHEEPVTQVTSPSGSTSTFETVFVPDLPINVPVGWQLRVASVYADTFAIVANQAAGEF